MATVVQCASCYAQNSIQSTQVYRRQSGQADCMALFIHRVPRYVPRPRLVCHSPKMTLRQICRLLKIMRQVRKRAEVAAANGRLPIPASLVKSERGCLSCCCRRRRTISMKRFV